MRKFLMLGLLVPLLGVVSSETTVVTAQPAQPVFQTIILNGIEPPPPGVRQEVLWSGWGGIPEECVGLDGYFIVGTGFTPALPKNEFAIRIHCVIPAEQPIRVAFYQ